MWVLLSDSTASPRFTTPQLQVGDRTISTRAYMAAFNLKGAMQEKRVGDLSGGERNRVHLAKVMKGRYVRTSVNPSVRRLTRVCMCPGAQSL